MNPGLELILINFVFMFAIIFSVYAALGKEEGFLFSTKKLGIVMFWVLVSAWVIISPIRAAIIDMERNTLIATCYENNITLPEKYNAVIKQIKVDKYKRSLQTEEK